MRELLVDICASMPPSNVYGLLTPVAVAAAIFILVILLGYALFCGELLKDPYAGWDDWLALALFTALAAFVAAQLWRFAANYLRVRAQTRK